MKDPNPDNVNEYITNTIYNEGYVAGEDVGKRETAQKYSHDVAIAQQTKIVISMIFILILLFTNLMHIAIEARLNYLNHRGTTNGVK